LTASKVLDWPPISSLAHRMLGDLEAGASQHDSALEHFAEAVKMAQGASRRDVLIDALIGRGRWSARQGRVGAAHEDLGNALSYAIRGNFRVYHVDARLASALAFHAAGGIPRARSEAEYALQMSSEVSYFWGEMEADDFLESVNT